MKKHDTGIFLLEKFLKPHNISQSNLAKALQISRTRINDILKGKRAITADTDLRLCAFFGLKEGFFLNLHIESELKKTKQKIQNELSKISPFSTRNLRVALICGGPSPERGISLNSARSVLDHLSREGVDICPFYVDIFKNFYSISPSQLYSNTPSDFDFKLQSTAKALTHPELILALKATDITFPAIHGTFGEDGELQSLLEKHSIPFIGSGSSTCLKMFDKHNAATLLKRHGFKTIPTEVLRKNSPHIKRIISHFFHDNSLSRVIVKPIAGGSSIGVSSAYTPEEAFEKTIALFEKNIGTEALLEPFCKGKEFTIIVLQNCDGSPVSLLPTEVCVNYDNGGIFDYRRKYLPSTNTHWFCPPRFNDATIKEIRTKAEELFSLFSMKDFARIDGWVLDNGEIIFTDFNPISGMEQNSFIFQQTSRIGLTHGDLLWNILRSSCARQNIIIPETLSPISSKQEPVKKPVHVLFGGSTAEKQVSLMSGTNVWLKLKKSKKYAPEAYLIDQNKCVWLLPYTYALNHTVEEIYENCLLFDSSIDKIEELVQDVKNRLNYAPKNYSPKENLPKKFSFDEFLDHSKKQDAFIFLALHGGEGENGIIQEKLEKKGLSYNGSNPKASEICMDKFLTGQIISNLNDPYIKTVPKKQIHISSFTQFTKNDYEPLWKALSQELNSNTFIIKPQRDGCSAGIVRLVNASELSTYIYLIQKRATHIPENTFTNQTQPIEMPANSENDFLIESFIETDYIRISNNNLVYKPKTGWIELTVGVIEKGGIYHSFNPSITIAEGDVLSVEEKFQGGTGVNITPPQEEIISLKSRNLIKKYIEKIAKTLGIQNYARLDVFFNIHSHILYLIEANSLPGLTPATVLYHQALSETSPLYPKDFLEHLIETKK